VLVLLAFFALSVGGAVIASAIGAYVLVGLFRAGEYNMSTYVRARRFRPVLEYVPLCVDGYRFSCHLSRCSLAFWGTCIMPAYRRSFDETFD
jgi:hypothetical protein